MSYVTLVSSVNLMFLNPDFCSYSPFPSFLLFFLLVFVLPPLPVPSSRPLPSHFRCSSRRSLSFRSVDRSSEWEARWFVAGDDDDDDGDDDDDDDDDDDAFNAAMMTDSYYNNNNNSSQVGRVLSSLPYWNSGENHLIFNFLPGLAPDKESFPDIQIGRAMVAGG